MYKGEVYIVNGLYKTIWLQREKTGEKIHIAASTKPKFRAGKALKEAVL